MLGDLADTIHDRNRCNSDGSYQLRRRRRPAGSRNRSARRWTTIGRFIEMLRSMMENTQFIIITHSRKTMEIANRLYGVTMEEPGVSKLIPMQLNEPVSRFPELISGSRSCAYAGPGIGR